jgi:hypothetical protein
MKDITENYRTYRREYYNNNKEKYKKVNHNPDKQTINNEKRRNTFKECNFCKTYLICHILINI